MALIAYYAPIKCKWWKTKKIELSSKKWKFEATILSEDFSMYSIAITRMLALDVWWLVEAYYRRNQTGNIRTILINRLGKIPPAINTLRLLKNCLHNEGFHTAGGPDASFEHKVQEFNFRFKQGNPIKNYSLPPILKLIDETLKELINS